jgi:hypothetical protein
MKAGSFSGYGSQRVPATSVSDWVTSLPLLRADPALWARLGLAGRGKIAEQYSIQVTAPRLGRLPYSVEK